MMIQVPIEVQYELMTANACRKAGDTQGFHDAHIRVAQMCLRVGRGDVAGNHYVMVADSTRPNPALRMRAAQAFTSAGKLFAALCQVETAISEQPNAVEKHILNSLLWELKPQVDELRAKRTSLRQNQMQIDAVRC